MPHRRFIAPAIGVVVTAVAGWWVVRSIAPATADHGYGRARVVTVLEQGLRTVDGQNEQFQKIEAKLLDGPQKGAVVTIESNDLVTSAAGVQAQEGQTIIVAMDRTQAGDQYEIVDQYRNRRLILLVLLFVLLALMFGGGRGITALLGLVWTFVIIVKFIVPRIISGANPMLVGIEGAFAIAVVSLYLAHGWSKRTSVAVGSTLLTLTLAIFAAVVSVNATGLLGLGSEEVLYLPDIIGRINLKGLLLAGIIIGTLGVLDDITTGQTAVVDEIAKANPRLKPWELYRRGLSVGREHIASLVNTLILAYAGASFPLFLLLVLGGDRPLWVTLNSEFLAEEIVRTLVGSATLIMAVPISTALAAVLLKTREKKG
ncbi:YibE/F family protein [Candidatus Uhrbacteria bacterium]|nr:YibE/F family protein [Candidatus Uhrbacteria bacterium]